MEYQRINTGGWSPDSELRLADWPKTRAWDLPREVDEFLDVISEGAPRDDIRTRREALNHFMDLPAAERMPVTLRAALVAGKWLDEIL